MREISKTSAQIRATSPLEQTRLTSLDAARTVAIFAIVWIHTPRSDAMIPTIAIGRFAVPFFVAAAVLMMLRGFASKPDRSLAQFARSRAQRLAIPFVAWTVIYLLFKLAKRVIAPDQPNDFPGWEILFQGSAYHLWFLPFLIFVSLFVACTAKPVIGIRHTCFAGVLAALVALRLAITPFPGQHLAWDGLSFMWLALPAVFAAYAVFLFLRADVDWWRHEPVIRSVSVCVLIGSTIYLSRAGRNGVAEDFGWNLFSVPRAAMAQQQFE